MDMERAGRMRVRMLTLVYPGFDKGNNLCFCKKEDAMKKEEFIGAVIGFLSPHIETIITLTWWDDWVKPGVQSVIGAVIGGIVLHYLPMLLRSFDNWRNIRRLNKFKNK
jgi:hypothetical protein